MKKTLISLMAAAAVLLVSSCAKEVVPSASEGNEATVTFTIGLEDVVATRATGDGSQCDLLVYEVYDANGVKIEELSGKKEGAFTNLEAEVPFTLVKGQTYSFAFWAQDADCKAYTTTNLQRVEVTYTDDSNLETRDAFFGNVDDIEVKGDFEQPVTLKRPFAQLNLGVAEEELAAIKKAGIALDQVEVVISEVAANFNTRTGEVEGAVGPVTYKLADVINKATDAEKLELKEALDGKTSFDWIAMNYLLVNGEAKANADVTFTLTTVDALTTTEEPVEKAPIVLTSTNTPLQRNFRTNIIAKLTSVGTFKIVIDPIFDGEYNGSIDQDNDTEDEENFEEYGVKGANGKLYKTLAEAINDGATDIELAAGEYTLNVNFTQDVTITGADKEGVKVTVPKSIYGDSYKNSLTLKNLTVAVPTGLAYNESTFAFVHRVKNFTMVDCKSNGRIRLNVENGLVDNCEFNMDVKSRFDGYAIFYYGGNNSNVKVSNSTFETAGKAIVLYNESAQVLNLDVENCTFVSSDSTTDKAAIQMHTEYGIKGTVDIKNSTATGFANVNNGLWNCINNRTGVQTNDFVVNVAVADGVSQVNGEYLISNAAGMYWFANQVNEVGDKFEGKTVKLTENIDLENKIWEPIGQTTAAGYFRGTFNGNNKTISNLKVDELSENSTFGAAGLFGWFEGGAVVKDLTIDGADIKGHHWVGGIVGYCYGKILNCTVKNAKVSALWSPVVANDEDNAAEHPLGNNGDKAGAIVGYFPYDGASELSDCHAENCQIDAVRDAGKLAGAASLSQVSGTSTHVTVSNNDSAPEWALKNNTNIDANDLVGRAL